MTRGPRLLLALAAVAVAFAAADTYVVVLALPDMMASVGISIDELQRGAPIVSGFLLGYVAMLPLIGRIADLRGRVPVLVAALVLFAAGSLVTTLAYDLPTLVTGRFLQGVGGGGLVPATLALVADLYPVERRGVPLGIVSAVQEIGSVVGPLYGAIVLAVSQWQVIFAINLVVGLVLAVAIRRTTGGRPTSPTDEPDRPAPRRTGLRTFDWAGIVFLLIALGAGGLVFLQPTALVSDVTWGQVFIPVAGSGRWPTPVGLVAILAALLFTVRCWTARRPLVDLPGWWRSVREADLPGALFLAAALAGVILAFSTADPRVEVFAPQGWWYLLGAAAATAVLVWHLRTDQSPLVPRGALRRRPAWGALLVSFFIGAALIAALIDIPIFARTTVYPDSQLLAALVLVRFLVAIPVGAVAGGYLTRTLPAGVVAGAGMALAALGFLLMTGWGLTTLSDWSANVSLLVGGLGFGLALAPVNAAVLASTDREVHGLASAGVVVARMVGMLVGISGLTTIGLRRYYAETRDMPPPMQVCGGTTSRCDAFDNLLRHAGIAQEHTVFAGAAVCAVVAALLALLLFRGAPTRSVGASALARLAG
ncbi:MFS transporter [Nocardioides cynanchi]|uniref:MFS transporter n=1 Tax=Nocardioides cynanchi TaxID=2558918 RepID=UPI00307EE94D